MHLVCLHQLKNIQITHTLSFHAKMIQKLNIFYKCISIISKTFATKLTYGFTLFCYISPVHFTFCIIVCDKINFRLERLKNTLNHERILKSHMLFVHRFTRSLAKPLKNNRQIIMKNIVAKYIASASEPKLGKIISMDIKIQMPKANKTQFLSYGI